MVQSSVLLDSVMAAVVLLDQSLVHQRRQRRVCPMRVLFKNRAFERLPRDLPPRT